MFDLTGKNALVTGASGGIGAEIARSLHARGATVGLSGTRTDLLFADNVIAARVRGQGDENARITLLGNRLGTDAAGLVALNFGAEVELFGADMTLGGPAVAERNVVLGRVSLAGTGARVRNLHLGVDLPGRRALSNNATLVVAGEGALIGGVDPADRTCWWAASSSPGAAIACRATSSAWTARARRRWG